MCLRVSFKKKNIKIIFCILKVTEERSRIRIRWSEVRIRGSRSAQKMSRIPNTGRTQEVENVERKYVGWLTSCLRRVTVISTTSPSLLPGHLQTEKDKLHNNNRNYNQA
jgi:hypothetical protein